MSREHPQFSFLDIRRHAQGGQAHEVAFFDWCGIEFALIPGAEVDLGYDPAHPWVPSPEESQGYEAIRLLEARKVQSTDIPSQGPMARAPQHVQIVPPCEMPPLETYIERIHDPTTARADRTVPARSLDKPRGH